MARRIELNGALGLVETAKTLRKLGLQPEARFLEVAGGYALDIGSDLPINRVSAVGLNGPVSLEEWDKIESFYAELNLPVKLEICPYTDPALVKLMGERGYQIGGFFNQHFRPLALTDARPESVEGVKVIQVDKNSAEGQSWIKTVSRAFVGKPEDEPDEFNLAMATSNLHGENHSCFLALVDGEPAGGGAMAIRGGLVSFFSTATLPKFRGKGVQKAFIQVRLAEAQIMGCDLATVMTAPGNNSQRNLERQGFRVAYTKMIMTKNS
jgi:GNAT superfamily N-acetyltransferase